MGVSSSQATVCAGGVSSAMHQATITAVVKDGKNVVIPNASVSFSVANANSNDASDEIGSLSSSSATTDSNGVARVTFTSSHVIGAKNKVTASYGGVSNSVTITMGDEDGDITPPDRTDLVADGQDSVVLKWPLTFGSSPVTGHSIQWKMVDVTDEDGNPVDPANYSDYGTIISGPLDANGAYTAKYTTGTKGGSISFDATDTTVVVKSAGGTGNVGASSVSSTATTSSTRSPKKKGWSAAKQKGWIRAGSAQMQGGGYVTNVKGMDTGSSNMTMSYIKSSKDFGKARIAGRYFTWKRDMFAHAFMSVSTFETQTVNAAAAGKLLVKGTTYEVQAAVSSVNSSWSWSLPSVSAGPVDWSPGAIVFQVSNGNDDDQDTNVNSDTIADAEIPFDHIPDDTATMTAPSAASVAGKVVKGTRSDADTLVTVKWSTAKQGSLGANYKFINPIR